MPVSWLPWGHGFLPFPDTTRAVTLYTPLATEEPETEVWFLLSERSFCSMVRLNHVNGTSLRWRLCVASRAQCC